MIILYHQYWQVGILCGYLANVFEVTRVRTTPSAKLEIIISVESKSKNPTSPKNNSHCAQILPVLEFGSSLLSSPSYVQHFELGTVPNPCQKKHYPCCLLQAAPDQRIKSIQAQMRRTRDRRGLFQRLFLEEASSDQSGNESRKGAPSSSHSSKMICQ